MKRKTLLIVVAVVVVMAICSAVALAYWQTDKSIADNVITTAEFGLNAGGSVPISADHLVPQANLSIDPTQASTQYQTKYFYVTNTGDVPMMVYGFLTFTAGDASIADDVWVKITIAPTDTGWGDVSGTLSAAGGPYLVYRGPLSNLEGAYNGRYYLSSVTPTTHSHTLLGAGQEAWYKVSIWLNQDAGIETQGKSLTSTLTFHGMQEQAWIDAGYDGTWGP